MTPELTLLKMQFEFALAMAAYHAPDVKQEPIIEKWLKDAKKAINEFEKAIAPKPERVATWVLRRLPRADYVDDLNYVGVKESGAVGVCTYRLASDPLVLVFASKESAEQYAHEANMWRCWEPELLA